MESDHPAETRTIRDQLEEAIFTHPEETFGIADLQEAFPHLDRNQIIQGAYHLVRKGVIEIVQKGRGGRFALYKIHPSYQLPTKAKPVPSIPRSKVKSPGILVDEFLITKRPFEEFDHGDLTKATKSKTPASYMRSYIGEDTIKVKEVVDVSHSGAQRKKKIYYKEPSWKPKRIQQQVEKEVKESIDIDLKKLSDRQINKLKEELTNELFISFDSIGEAVCKKLFNLMIQNQEQATQIIQLKSELQAVSEMQAETLKQLTEFQSRLARMVTTRGIKFPELKNLLPEIREFTASNRR